MTSGVAKAFVGCLGIVIITSNAQAQVLHPFASDNHSIQANFNLGIYDSFYETSGVGMDFRYQYFIDRGLGIGFGGGYALVPGNNSSIVYTLGPHFIKYFHFQSTKLLPYLLIGYVGVHDATDDDQYSNQFLGATGLTVPMSKRFFVVGEVNFRTNITRPLYRTGFSLGVLVHLGSQM